jgi:integrase
MSVYERGTVWWYKFQFGGQQIRESSHSTSKTLAIRAERERRRQPEHFIFPSERYGLDGENGYLHGAQVRYNVRPDVPLGSWKVAWKMALERANVECRWHDLRHTFVSRMAESLASDATIMALAGHLSAKMKERYSHVRTEAKRQAIATLDGPSVTLQ